MQEFIPSLKRFALIGAAGYIAPRHLKAIKDTGNVLVAAMDKSDSVGVLDSYFPGASFFTEFERFDRFLEKLRRADPAGGIDCLSIATPNYLHDAHIRFALRLGASAICEKPVVLNPWNLDALKAIEAEYGRKVYTVLQMSAPPGPSGAEVAGRDRPGRAGLRRRADQCHGPRPMVFLFLERG